MTAQDILKLIETVSPDDSDALRTLDCEVCCYVEQTRYVSEYIPYSTSRDALKAIRPYQGHSLFRLFNSDSWDAWQAQISWYPTSVAKYCTSPHLPTEELAELHAIIQAIEYERNK